MEKGNNMTTATTLNPKEVVEELDRAAARAHIISKCPATSKQCWFLATLISKQNDEATYSDFLVNTSTVLTKSKASEMIAWYLNLK